MADPTSPPVDEAVNSSSFSQKMKPLLDMAADSAALLNPEGAVQKAVGDQEETEPFESEPPGQKSPSQENPPQENLASGKSARSSSEGTSNSAGSSTGEGKGITVKSAAVSGDPGSHNRASQVTGDANSGSPTESAPPERGETTVGGGSGEPSVVVKSLTPEVLKSELEQKGFLVFSQEEWDKSAAGNGSGDSRVAVKSLASEVLQSELEQKGFIVFSQEEWKKTAEKGWSDFQELFKSFSQSQGNAKALQKVVSTLPQILSALGDHLDSRLTEIGKNMDRLWSQNEEVAKSFQETPPPEPEIGLQFAEDSEIWPQIFNPGKGGGQSFDQVLSQLDSSPFLRSKFLSKPIFTT